MNKTFTLKRKTGLFDEQWLYSDDFWSNQQAALPTQIDHKSFVYIKTKKKLLKEYTVKTLILSDSVLYLVGKKTNKVYKTIDLVNTPCKLYDYMLDKGKYQYKMVLRHHSMSAEFFFQEQQAIELWIASLRTLCLMCDFTSVYSMGNLQVNSTLFRVFWAQEKATGKPFSANVYNLFEDANSEDDIQTKIEKQVIVNEIKALRAIDHPNILQLMEVHEFKDRVVMVTELITGSTLLRHILSQGSLPELETSYIMKTILQAIQALHNKKILHRNLKPENIILNHSNNGTEIKLTSFGFSCSFDKAEPTTWHVSKNICSKCGTPGYMAPELLGHKKSVPAGDVFSLGVILYTCLTGEPMFKGRTAEDIIVKNLKVNFEKTRKWYLLSENARDLIQSMVREDPAERPSIDAILRHSFFTQKNTFLNPNTLGFDLKMTMHSTGETAPQTKRNSIDELMLLSDRNKVPIDKVMQSLIVSPTYFDFTKGDVPEVPEFYIDDVEDFIDRADSTSLKWNSPGKSKYSSRLKLEILRGSVAHLDPEVKTPNFKKKLPKEDKEEAAEENHVDSEMSDEEDEDDETSHDLDIDESYVCHNYQKLNTFPKFKSSPFISQKPIVQKFNTINFKTQTSFPPEFLPTGRKLPSVHKDVRKILEAKKTIIDEL